MKLLNLHLLLVALALSLYGQSANGPFDVVIEHGYVIDGTGSPWYSADVGIRAGRIAAIGRLTGAETRRRIDVRGKVVAPGFIDMLGQSDLTILVNPHLPSKIFQGITTEITGEGGSVAPLNEALIQADHLLFDHLRIIPDWQTVDDYFARLEKQGIGINFAAYIGATQVRRIVLGDGEENGVLLLYKELDVSAVVEVSCLSWHGLFESTERAVGTI